VSACFHAVRCMLYALSRRLVYWSVSSPLVARLVEFLVQLKLSEIGIARYARRLLTLLYWYSHSVFCFSPFHELQYEHYIPSGLFGVVSVFCQVLTLLHFCYCP
jgi:hypothetical protein